MLEKRQGIGLSELINRVKEELLSNEFGDPMVAPFFSVDKVSIEAKVTVSKEGNAGIKIYVVEIGGGVGREDVQTVTVTLSPLLSKEERIRRYKALYPDRMKALEYVNVQGGMKGTDDESLADQFGERVVNTQE